MRKKDKQHRQRACRGWRVPASCWFGATLVMLAGAAQAQDADSTRWRDGADGIGFYPGGDAPGFDASSWRTPGQAGRTRGATVGAVAPAVDPNAPPRRLTEETITLGHDASASVAPGAGVQGDDGIGFADVPNRAPSERRLSASARSERAASPSNSTDMCGDHVCGPGDGPVRPPAGPAPRFIAGVRYDRMPYELHPIDSQQLPDLPEAQWPSIVEQLQGDDSNMIGIGWHYIVTTGRSTRVTTETGALGIGSFDNPGSSVQINNMNTLALAFTHFFTEHVTAKLLAGLPPKLTMYGKGSIGLPFDKIFPGTSGSLPLINLANPNSNPLGTTRAWPITILMEYYLGKREDRFRPYFGAGLSYTRFTHTSLNSVFAQKLSSLGGLLSAGMSIGTLQSLLTSPDALNRLLQAGADLILPTGAHATASVRSAWSPVFTLGANYQLTRNLSLSGSLTYMALRTTINVNINDPKRVLAKNSVKLSANPILCTVLLNYRF
ncbi:MULTISPECIES: OmpW/AlkL family protein [Burkholderia]|uniref:OmpW/AlkL family protein n=1 Tax=Burkholderia TaxID=32008 RepID=UPI000841EF34|nr:MULTISPECIES: OmpW family outer membrane protein [unclassified Burkholderia]AOK31999.1 OmpW family protein [Burkholderia sp. Bp7605]